MFKVKVKIFLKTFVYKRRLWKFIKQSQVVPDLQLVVNGLRIACDGTVSLHGTSAIKDNYLETLPQTTWVQILAEKGIRE